MSEEGQIRNALIKNKRLTEQEAKDAHIYKNLVGWFLAITISDSAVVRRNVTAGYLYVADCRKCQGSRSTGGAGVERNR